MRDLEYPFDSQWILKKKKYIRNILRNKTNLIVKKVAILGGQTTHDIKDILELFLLNQGIKPFFYESEYNQYYEDGLFGNEKLDDFYPDIVYFCTCTKNIKTFPIMQDSKKDIDDKLNAEYVKFESMWESVYKKFNCQIIQNNFEYPFYRLMGNMDASDSHGRVNFVTKLNQKFYNYAENNANFHICDVNYISSAYGLDKWANPYYWHMYKYSMEVNAIPYLAFNVSNIIKSIYGKNKKALNLDLDNTLWGGIVGDDGVEGIEIGQENSISQTYSEFQQYLKLHKQLGVLLTVNSKNDKGNALAGLNRPDSVLKPDDFVIIKANWQPKNLNLLETANELNLLPESFVFVDDNPAEREIIFSQFNNVATPLIDKVENYIHIIDKSGFFEVTSISNDDIKRNDMYKENAKRLEYKNAFVDYNEYLLSLEMVAEIREFVPIYMSRIAQLTNKSNQFNLTTKRFSLSDIEEIAKNKKYITLYGKLEDKFGDNGVVSVVIGKIINDDIKTLHIDLWLMSCRVLKRNMEFAMMDELIKKAKQQNIKKIFGYYYPTEKNKMVKDFYLIQGFEKISEDEKGNIVWVYNIPNDYMDKQSVIKII